MTERDLAEQLATAARELQSETSMENTLDKMVALCVELIDGCDEAGVSIVHRGSIDTPAATSHMVGRGDLLQYELSEGPCLDSIRQQETVYSPDLANEGRWPTWGPRVVEELEVRSMLCLQLYVDGDNLGALNMYSRRVDGFDDSDRAEGLALAAHAAVAVAAAQEVQQLQDAVTSRTTIGQAEGILMERFDLAPEAAFNVLKRVSQNQNVKLHQVAAELVQTRKTPGV